MSNVYQSDPSFEQPAERSGGGRWWIVILAGAGLFFVLACCGGGLGLGMLGIQVEEASLETQLRDNPQVRQHVGEISEFKTNYSKSFANEDEDMWVYDVQGSKGNAELTITTSTAADFESTIEGVVMRLPTGETIEVDLDDNGTEMP